MRRSIVALAVLVSFAALTLPRLAAAQTAPAIPPAITTPDRVDSRIGQLEFKDGAPSKATARQGLRPHRLHPRVQRVRRTRWKASASTPLRKGLLSAGVKDNEVIVFSELMDAKSLFLTANADTIYALGVLDLTKGPMVLEVPPRFLGAIDDYWFRWVIDIGLPGAGPRRGREVPDPAARLRRSAAGGRVLRRPRPDHPRPVVRPLVPGEQERSEAGGRNDPEVHQGLPLRGRRRRHAHRRVPGRQGPARRGSHRRRRPCSTKAAAR